MSLAEQLKADGLNQGKIEIAERLLAEKIELAFIAKITGFFVALAKL